MDHDREVSPSNGDDPKALASIEESKAWFLQTALEEFRTAQEQYNLNDEFAKTRRNRNFVVLLAVVGTSLVFGLAAFLLSGFYESRNNTVKISTQEFDDINLRELLDKAKKLESDLGFAQTQLATLDAAQAADLEKARQAMADQLALFRSRNPTEEALAAETASRAKRLAGTLAAIENGYAAKRLPVNEQIATIQAEMAAIDTRKLEVARQREVIINNERKVYDTERQRIQSALETRIQQLTNDYESRLAQRERFALELETSAHATLVKEQARLKLLYNPMLDDEIGTRLLALPVDQSRLDGGLPIPDSYRDTVSPARLAAVNQDLGEYRSLLALLRQVPWANAMPAALTQLQYRALSAVDDTAAIFEDFWKVIKEREATIAEREATIALRDDTIAQRDQTILERDAAIQDRDNRIGSLQDDLKDRDTSIAGATAQINTLLASFARTAKSSRTGGVVVDPGDPQAIQAWINPELQAAAGQRFYLLHGTAEVLGEYALTTTDTLSILKPAAPAASPKPPAGVSRPSFSGKPVLTMDWLIRVEDYAAWKASLAKNPVR